MPIALDPPNAVDSHQHQHHDHSHPSDVTMIATTQSQSQWLFTEDELLLAPSIVDGGLSSEKERENRGKGVNFILQAGIMLKLPQITLATASVFLHRFYMRHSMVDSPTKGPGFHYYSMAATCLFLATKVEENCRKMKELVIACVRVAQKDPYKLVDEQDKEYWRWRDNILHSEDVLLEALCFDLSLEAPYKTLFDLLLQFHVESSKKLRNSAWAFVNDSCLTQLCLLFSSRTIAASAFYAAAKYTQTAFPDDGIGRPWWHAIGIDIGEIRKACNYMAEMYENVPTKPGRDGLVYEKTPNIHELDDQTRIRSTRSEDHNGANESLDSTEAGRGSKRERDEEAEENKDNLAAVVDPAGSNPVHNGTAEASPFKKRKIKEESPVNGNDTSAPDTQTRPAAPANATTNGKTSPQPSSTKQEAQPVVKASTGNLAKENDEEVSEEGEVES